MYSMLHFGKVVRIEEHTPYSKRKTVYFAIPSVTDKEVVEEEDEETASSFIEGILGGFAIGEGGKITKLF